MKIPFSEIVNRITGFSTPAFGLSWEPPMSEVVIARRLLTFLEDKRVLYTPYIQEDLVYASESISDIRERLTRDLEELKRETVLAQLLLPMRAACRQFLDKTQDIDPNELQFIKKWREWERQNNYDLIFFYSALGELRATFGIQIAHICVKYKLDVEASLAKIFPLPPENTEK